MSVNTGPTLGTTCQYYGGRQSNNPALLVKATAAPTTAQYKYPIGTFWINTTNGYMYYLADKAGNTGVWTLLASTDSVFAGSGTLVAGTATIASTGVTTGALIFLQRTLVNASTTLGELTIPTITNGVSFVVTSAIIGTPGSTQTGDLSSFSWWIVT